MTKKQGAKARVRTTAQVNGTSYTTALRENGANWLEVLIQEGLADSASDIFFELDAERSQLTVSFRVGAEKWPRPPISGAQLVTAIDALEKRAGVTLGNLLPATRTETRVLANGRQYAAHFLGLRTLTGGSLLKLRLPFTGAPLSLDQLGMSDGALDRLTTALTADQGLILFAGQVGAGKTTAAYAALSHLIATNEGRSGYWARTVEEPVERVIFGARQIGVDAASGASIEDIRRYLPRADRDVLLVGELRDTATAELCTWSSRSALTLTTIHAHDTLTALLAAVSHGGPETLANVPFVVSQRARLPRNLDGDGRSPTASSRFVHAFETLTVTDGLRTAVTAGRPLAELRELADLTTFGEDGARLVSSGPATAADVRREFGYR
jgi:type II secretory ATPase GspE/PulE/Tfp pilus assembly ATPase PilB-like protein